MKGRGKCKSCAKAACVVLCLFNHYYDLVVCTCAEALQKNLKYHFFGAGESPQEKHTFKQAHTHTHNTVSRQEHIYIMYSVELLVTGECWIDLICGGLA